MHTREFVCYSRCTDRTANSAILCNTLFRISSSRQLHTFVALSVHVSFRIGHHMTELCGLRRSQGLQKHRIMIRDMKGVKSMDSARARSK